MMSKLCTTLILLVGLVAILVQGSAIKGHNQAQPVQRVEEQARVSSVKSPASQLAERSPKSAPVQSAAPILESSKKVYNDVSYRRSVSQPQASELAQAPAAVEQVASVVAQQKASPDSAVPAAAPVAKAAEAPVAQASKPNDELPAQSVRSVPAKGEPEVPEQKSNVGQPASPDKTDLTARKSGCSNTHWCPADGAAAPSPVESKPVVPEVQQQSAVAAPVVAVAQPEPVEKAAAPVAADPKPVAPEAQVQQAPASLDARQMCVPRLCQTGAANAPESANAAVESKPAVPDVQQQPAAAAPVVSKAQPEPEEKAIAPVESSLQAKKDELSAKEAHEPIEVPAPDPGLVLSEPIDSTTKLLIDLDEHVQKFLPAEDKQELAQPPKEAVLVNGVDYSPPQAQSSDSQPSGKSSVPLMPYSSNADSEPIVPPLPASLDKVDKAAAAVTPAQVPSAGQSATRQANHNQHQNQQQVITQLLDQLDSLQNRIQDTINQLVARRRYVMSALLRPMGTYVRRVRTNLERLQNRVNQLQAAASSVGGNSQNQRPGGFVDAAAIETIRRRIDDISKRISDIVNRIRFSLTPTSAPLNNNGRK